MDALCKDEHKRIEGRVDSLTARLWWIFGVLLSVMTIGAGVAIEVWADTRDLKASEAAHASTFDLNVLRHERQRVDGQQTRALNWQTQAIEAIAKKVGAAEELPSRPPMIEPE